MLALPCWLMGQPIVLFATALQVAAFGACVGAHSLNVTKLPTPSSTCRLHMQGGRAPPQLVHLVSC